MNTSHSVEPELDDDEPEEIVRWRIPNVVNGEDSSTLVTQRPVGPPTAEEVAAWEEAGRAEGYERGYAQGQHKAHAENENLRQRLNSLINQLENTLHAFGEEAQRELVQLALVIAQQLIRRELRLDPGELVPLVRESVALLPSSARNVRVLMHPDDVVHVKDALGGADFDGAVKIVGDPLITRGGCQVDSEQSRLDATLETRLAALCASVLAAQREGDQSQ